MLQATRDRHINQACQQASAGYRSMHAALFSSFPQEARQRYPVLCTQIGQSPFPLLEGASGFETSMADLFGPVGGMMNELGTENKIMRDLSVVQQCEKIARQQHNLIVKVCNKIGASVAQMDQTLAQINGGIEAERRRIFEAVKSSDGQTPCTGANAGPVMAQAKAKAKAKAKGKAKAKAKAKANASVEQDLLIVTCPEGAMPGTSIQVQAPDGRLLAVEVPAGATPGSQFQVQF